MPRAQQIIDHLSAGIPVVSICPGRLDDRISGHQSGLVISGGASLGVADALVKMAGDQGRRKLMGRVARRLAEEQFADSRLAEWFAELLEECGRTSKVR